MPLGTNRHKKTSNSGKAEVWCKRRGRPAKGLLLFKRGTAIKRGRRKDIMFWGGGPGKLFKWSPKLH